MKIGDQLLKCLVLEVHFNCPEFQTQADLRSNDALRQSGALLQELQQSAAGRDVSAVAKTVCEEIVASPASAVCKKLTFDLLRSTRLTPDLWDTVLSGVRSDLAFPNPDVAAAALSVLSAVPHHHLARLVNDAHHEIAACFDSLRLAAAAAALGCVLARDDLVLLCDSSPSLLDRRAVPGRRARFFEPGTTRLNGPCRHGPVWSGPCRHGPMPNSTLRLGSASASTLHRRRRSQVCPATTGGEERERDHERKGRGARPRLGRAATGPCRGPDRLPRLPDRQLQRGEWLEQGKEGCRAALLHSGSQTGYCFGSSPGHRQWPPPMPGWHPVGSSQLEEAGHAAAKGRDRDGQGGRKKKEERKKREKGREREEGNPA